MVWKGDVWKSDVGRVMFGRVMFGRVMFGRMVFGRLLLPSRSRVDKAYGGHCIVQAIDPNPVAVCFRFIFRFFDMAPCSWPHYVYDYYNGLLISFKQLFQHMVYHKPLSGER
jgi:hypothetical protein